MDVEIIKDRQIEPLYLSTRFFSSNDLPLTFLFLAWGTQSDR